ncbi:MAG: cysteine-rich KTR domain-containing protein [Oscillospiraceae bacterium]
MTLKELEVHVENGWILCPHCGCKTRTKIKADTILVNYPLYCPKCKRETTIQLHSDKQLELDAKTLSR